MKYLIGTDIGTQGTKTTLFDLEGRAVVESFEASNLISPVSGKVWQEPDEVFASVMHTIKAVLEKSGADKKDVVALAFDGQMAGIMGVGADFQAVTYYDSWLDTRCEKYIRLMKETCGKKITEITGCPVTYDHGPKILWWKHEHPETYAKIRKFVTLSGYAAGRLCGLTAEKAFMDYTFIHFSGFADNEKKVWSNELLNTFGVDPDKMPGIVDPWKIVGYVNKQNASACGLAEGTPVLAGCGDSAANSLGAGIVRAGQIFDVAGTASIFSCGVSRYAPDVKHETLLQMRSVIDGLWLPLAYINGGGLCLRWFKDDIAKTDYATLEKEAKDISPGSCGLLFSPHFAGRVCPNDPNVMGSFLGLNWVHSRAHMFRAIMEGIAYEYRYYLDILKDQGLAEPPHTVYGIGGGAKSALFNQIKADVLGCEYAALKNSDTAPLGCAMIAGYGAGVFSDIAQTAERMTETGASFTPDLAKNEAYTKYYEAYKAQFGALEALSKMLKA